MKTVKVVLIIFISSFTILYSASVNMQTARDVVAFHLQIKNVANSYTIADVIELKNQKKQKLAYIINLKPNGYIVLATDTNINPIIAYSFVNNFPLINDKNNTLYNLLRKDMELRLAGMGDFGETTIRENNNIWTQYQNRNLVFFRNREFQQWPSRRSPTDGLVETTWMQGHPYNKFCPKSADSDIRCFVGSIGVALAQLINYHEYIGDIQFIIDDRYKTAGGINIDTDSQLHDYPNFGQLNQLLVNIQSSYDSNATLSIDDLAILNFSCALAIKTQFDNYESLASFQDAYNALINKFRYASARILSAQSSSFYDDLRYNIVNELPVIIEVQLREDNISRTRYERSIICDGYNTDRELHINFGWGINSENVTSAWYRLPAVSSLRNELFTNGIMYIEGKRRLVSDRSKEKIVLPQTTYTPLEELFTEEDLIPEESTAEEPEEDIRVNLTGNEENTQLGQTSRFVVYEVAPVPVKQIPPVYPEFLKREGITGEVWLEVEVFENGSVGAINVLKSLVPGPGGLDESAVTAVSQWEFSPAKSAGKTVACWVTFPVTFSLK